MASVQIDLGSDLSNLLVGLNQPLSVIARELIVLELYRRGTISSGKAAELLAMDRLAFIQHASRLGIPYFDMTEDEWHQELLEIGRL